MEKSKLEESLTSLGTIHLIIKQNFPKNQHFLLTA